MSWELSNTKMWAMRNRRVQWPTNERWPSSIFVHSHSYVFACFACFFFLFSLFFRYYFVREFLYLSHFQLKTLLFSLCFFVKIFFMTILYRSIKILILNAQKFFGYIFKSLWYLHNTQHQHRSPNSIVWQRKRKLKS